MEWRVILPLAHVDRPSINMPQVVTPLHLQNAPPCLASSLCECLLAADRYICFSSLEARGILELGCLAVKLNLYHGPVSVYIMQVTNLISSLVLHHEMAPQSIDSINSAHLVRHNLTKGLN